MNKINDAHYFILKVRYYADKKLLDKSHKKGEMLPKQHHERARMWVDFQWKLIEHLTGKPFTWWIGYYPLNTSDCAWEEVNEKGCDGQNPMYFWNEGWKVLYIPKSQPELRDWIYENCSNPIKEVKRYPLIMLRYSHKEETFKWQREHAIVFKNSMLEKNPEIYQQIYIR
jgi:hypothetical protein